MSTTEPEQPAPPASGAVSTSDRLGKCQPPPAGAGRDPALMPATRGVERSAKKAETGSAAFTELAETAVANAQSRDELERVAAEQAALRRVATLVAQGTSPQDLFEAVAEEVGRLLPVGSATMGRYEPDGSVTTVASWSTTDAAFPTGRRWPTEDTN